MDDETWITTDMAPPRGGAPRGKRVKAKVLHGHRQTMTFLAALPRDRITAPWLIDGTINGEFFRTHVEEVLVPTLRPGDIVIMDDLGSHRGYALGSHRGCAVRRAIRAAGARLFILPKCAQMIPIEQFFSKLRHSLRKAANAPSTMFSVQLAASSLRSMNSNIVQLYQW
jgi:putative transposase